MRFVIVLLVASLGCGPEAAPVSTQASEPSAATGASSPARKHSVESLPPTEAPPTTEQALARVGAHRERETSAFVSHPALVERGEACIAALPNEDPYDVGHALSIELIRFGLPLLSDEDLLRWIEIRRAMAGVYRPACAKLWTGTLDRPDLDVALANVGDPLASDFFRLRTLAAKTALANPGARVPASAEHVREVVEALLEEDTWRQASPLLDAPEVTIDQACFLEEAVFGGMASLEPRQRVDIVRELLALEAANPSVLPAVCFSP